MLAIELIATLEELVTAGCEVIVPEELDARAELIRTTELISTELDAVTTSFAGLVGLEESLQATRVSAIAEATNAVVKYFCFIPTFLLEVQYDDRI